MFGTNSQGRDTILDYEGAAIQDTICVYYRRLLLTRPRRGRDDEPGWVG